MGLLHLCSLGARFLDQRVCLPDDSAGVVSAVVTRARRPVLSLLPLCHEESIPIEQTEQLNGDPMSSVAQRAGVLRDAL